MRCAAIVHSIRREVSRVRQRGRSVALLGARSDGGACRSTAAFACVKGDVRGETVSIEREVGTVPSGEEAEILILGASGFRAAEV